MIGLGIGLAMGLVMGFGLISWATLSEQQKVKLEDVEERKGERWGKGLLRTAR
jgi:hypothetical protein